MKHTKIQQECSKIYNIRAVENNSLGRGTSGGTMNRALGCYESNTILLYDVYTIYEFLFMQHSLVPFTLPCLHLQLARDSTFTPS